MKKLFSVLFALTMFVFTSQALAMESPQEADPQKTIDAVYTKLNNAVQGWALNEWKADGKTLSFVKADQPCYLTKVAKGKGFARGCALPKPDYESASLMNDVVWPSLQGKDSYDCHYKREVIMAVVPQMLDNMDTGASYRPVLEALLSFAHSWKEAYPALGLMKPDGYCTIDYSRTPVEYQIELPAH